MTDREAVEKLLAACNAYHEALDLAFAMLIITTGPSAQPMPPFMPTKSRMWPACVEGKRLVDEIERTMGRQAGDEIKLTKNEWTVLQAVYDAQKSGDTPLDDEALAKATGLSVEQVMSATGYLAQIGYISE